MANQVTTSIAVIMYSDGSSTTFSFDLLKDHYFIVSDDLTPAEGAPINWFASDLKSNPPTGVQPLSQTIPSTAQTYTASLSGTVVTITLSAAVPVGGYGLAVYPTY